MKHERVMSWPLALLSLVSGLVQMWIWSGRTQPDDLGSLWIAGDLVARGKQIHLYDHNPDDFSALAGEVWLKAAAEISAPFPHIFVHNPVIAYFMSLFTRWMTFDAFVNVVLFLSGMTLVVLVAGSYHLWFRSTIPLGIAAVGVSIVTLFPATATGLWLGQTTPLIMAGIAYALAASRVTPVRAGIVLGLVTAVKLTPFVLIPVLLFFAYRRRTAYYALGTIGVVTVVTLLVVDFKLITKWLGRLQDIGDSVLVSGANQSLASIISLDGESPTLMVKIVPEVPALATAVSMGLAVALTALALVVSWFNRAYRFEILSVTAFGVVTAFSAIVWNHYIIVVVLFVAGVFAMSGSRFTRSWPSFGVAALIVLLAPPVTNPVVGVGDGHGFFFSGITGLICIMVWLLIVAGFDAASAQGRRVGEPMLGFDYLAALREQQAPRKHTAPRG